MHPQLDPSAVLSALEAVKAAHPLPAQHPMHSFILIQHLLTRPEYVAGDYGFLAACAELLERCCLDVLGQRSTPLADLRTDFLSTEDRHQAYSWLYHRYLCPAFEMSVEQLAEVIGFTTRSLQRRQQEGLGLLTQDLCRREIAARREHRAAVLGQSIPYASPLLGRQVELDHAEAALRDGYPLLIVGSPGQGKTHFVSALTRRFLQETEAILWITLQPRLSLLAQLAFSLGLDALDTAALPLYLAAHKVYLVLENALPEHLEQIAQQRGLFHQTWLVVTARTFEEVWSGVRIDLPLLERSDAEALFQAVTDRAYHSAFPQVWAAVGGHPLGLLRQAQRLTASEGWAASSELIAHYQRLWDGADHSIRLAWSSLYWSGSEGLSDDLLLQIAPLSSTSLDALRKGYVIEFWQTPSPHYRLSTAAADFVKAYAGVLVEDLLERCYSLLPAQAVVEKVLSWLVHGLGTALTPSRLLGLLDTLAFVVARYSLWATWGEVLATLEGFFKSPYQGAWLTLEQSRLERVQGLLAQARRHLEALIEVTGQAGFFDLQARTLLELAILGVYNPAYPDTFTLAQAAQQMCQRLKLDQWGQLADLTLAQAVLDHDAALALRTVLPWVAEVGSAAAIASRAALQLNEPERAVVYAEKALNLTTDYSPAQGRALAALAGLWYQLQNPEVALDYQTQAVNILQMTSDVVGLARAYNNLGVLYYELQQPDQAQAAWKAALQLLLPLQDGLALRTVRANLALAAPAQMI